MAAVTTCHRKKFLSLYLVLYSPLEFGNQSLTLVAVVALPLIVLFSFNPDLFLTSISNSIALG